MLFLVALLLFISCVYILTRIIVRYINRLKFKKVKRIRHLDVFTGCITASLSATIYSVYVDRKETIKVENWSEFLFFFSDLFLALVGGGILIMIVGGICILPFVPFYQKYSEEFGIPEDKIFDIYISMFFMTTMSISIVMLTSLYFIKLHS